MAALPRRVRAAPGRGRRRFYPQSMWINTHAMAVERSSTGPTLGCAILRHRPASRPYTARALPVAQWIVHAPPKREIPVRLQAGGPPRQSSACAQAILRCAKRGLLPVWPFRLPVDLPHGQGPQYRHGPRQRPAPIGSTHSKPLISLIPPGNFGADCTPVARACRIRRRAPTTSACGSAAARQWTRRRRRAPRAGSSSRSCGAPRDSSAWPVP